MQVFDYSLHDYSSFTDLYQSIVSQLIHDPEYIISPRGMKVREFVNATVIVKPDECHIDFGLTKAPERQEAYDRYKKAEHDWYLSGNTLASSAPSKFWNQLAQPDGHITSNYGHMMLFDKIYPPTQEEWNNSLAGDLPLQIQARNPHKYSTAFEKVIDTILKDNDSRQAIVHYNQPRHCYPTNKDFPCTVYSQFFVRNGVLSMTTYQRSCDIIKGFSYDVPWNCSFMAMVRDELEKRGLKLALGEFTHVFGSLHLYEKDLELASRIAENA